MHKNDFLKPPIIEVQRVSATQAKVVMDPFERVYGHTLGNSLYIDNTWFQKIILMHNRLRVDYLEYNSTIRCSLIVAGSSERCGLALNVPFIALASTSIHSGKPRCSAASTAALMRNCARDFSAISTTSPGRTWNDG